MTPPVAAAAEPTAGPDVGPLAALTPEQRAAAEAPGPLLVLAGAGTGKTKTLVAACAHRIAARGVAPGRVLMVTFTNRAAREMGERLRALLGGGGAGAAFAPVVPGWLGTFHGLAARQLREEPGMAGLRPGFDILDADDARRLLRRTLKAAAGSAAPPPGPDDDGGGGEAAAAAATRAAAGQGTDPVKRLADRISRWKDRLLDPAAARLSVPADAPDAAARRAEAAAYAAYQAALREANAADFGDLLMWPALAMARCAETRARWAARFDCALVDEAQDTNPAQDLWLAGMAAATDDVVMVGDDSQAIFGWRGAGLAGLRAFAARKGARALRLERNFRSTGLILDAANAVVARDATRLPKTLWTRAGAGDPVEVVRFGDAEGEAGGIAAEILRRRARDGLPWDAFAVLYRSNSLSRPVEEALIRARVPHLLVGDVGFWSRAEVKHALALLRLSETAAPGAGAGPDPLADDAFRRTANVPPRGLGERAMAALEEHAAWRRVPLLDAAAAAAPGLGPRARGEAARFADLVRAAARAEATVAGRLAALLDATGYRAWLRAGGEENADARLENLAELVGLAGAFRSAAELLDHAALATGAPAEERHDAERGEGGGAEAGRVKLLTMHRAKGLEFHHVFLPAWEPGIFPAPFACDTDEGAAEERRLAHVALTRGMRRVTVSWCAWRRGRRNAGPAEYVADIPAPARLDGWLRDAGMARPEAAAVGGGGGRRPRRERGGAAADAW